MNWFKKAFAIEKEGVVEPTAEQKKVVDRVCLEVVRRHLTTPALLALETSRPLNYIGSQLIHFFTPMLSVFIDPQAPTLFAKFLEHRGSIDYLCRTIEDFEAEMIQRQEQSEETNSKTKEEPQ